MIKVAFVIESLNIGGAEKSLTNLLHKIDCRCLQIDLYMLHEGGKFYDLLPDFINVKRIKSKKVSLLQRLKFFLAKKYHLRHLHKAQSFWKFMHSNYEQIAQPYQVAIAYNQGFATYFVASKMKAERKYAWVNTDYHSAGYAAERDRQYYDQFDKVVVVSEYVKRIFQNIFKNISVEVIYDITDVNDILRRSEEKIPRIENNEISIMTVGRLVKAKNYTLAIETAALIKENRIPFKWFFLGDGEEREMLRKLIKDKQLEENIIILGHKKNPYPYMKNADIYVHTSSYEGWGLSLIEAKILGKPVVTTNFPTSYEIIQDGVTGFITEMRADALAEKILQLIHDRDLRKYMSVNNIVEVDKRNYETAATVNKMTHTNI